MNQPDFDNKGDANGRNNSNVFTVLRGQLQLLGFRSFQQCVWIWLAAQGYQHMRVLDRTHRRGRRSAAGADFIVQVSNNSEIQLAVQIRHWRTPITRAAIDQFRGHLLRIGIPAGMIVASTDFLPSARIAAEAYPGRPIRLVSIHRLAYSMLGLELGVRRSRIGWRLDPGFFRSLKHLRFASPSKLRPRSAGVSSLPPHRPDNDFGPLPYVFGFWIVTIIAVIALLNR